MDAWKKIKTILSGKPVVSVVLPKEEWDRQYVGGRWDRLVHEVQPNTKYIASYCEEVSKTLGRPIHIVDLGCGNGGLGAILAKDSVASYVGVDVSKVALVAAREKFPQGTYRVCDVSASLPPEISEADVVVCNEVLYYVPVQDFLRRLRSFAPKRVAFSYYRSWRSRILGFFIFMYFGFGKRYGVEKAGQFWTIRIYEK